MPTLPCGSRFMQAMLKKKVEWFLFTLLPQQSTAHISSTLLTHLRQQRLLPLGYPRWSVLLSPEPLAEGLFPWLLGDILVPLIQFSVPSAIFNLSDHVLNGDVMSVLKANSNAWEESLIWLCNCNRRLWTRLKDRDKKMWGSERRPLYIHWYTIDRLPRRPGSQHKTVFRRRHGKRQRGHLLFTAHGCCFGYTSMWLMVSTVDLLFSDPCLLSKGELRNIPCSCLSVTTRDPTNLPGFQCGSWLRW